MTYWTKDGIKLDGSTPRQVMASLRSHAWFGSRDLETYMQKCAKFAGYISGQVIRSGDASELLADLMKSKFIFQREERVKG